MRATLTQLCVVADCVPKPCSVRPSRRTGHRFGSSVRFGIAEGAEERARHRRQGRDSGGHDRRSAAMHHHRQDREDDAVSMIVMTMTTTIKKHDDRESQESRQRATAVQCGECAALLSAPPPSHCGCLATECQSGVGPLPPAPGSPPRTSRPSGLSAPHSRRITEAYELTARRRRGGAARRGHGSSPRASAEHAPLSALQRAQRGHLAEAERALQVPHVHRRLRAARAGKVSTAAFARMPVIFSRDSSSRSTRSSTSCVRRSPAIRLRPRKSGRQASLILKAQRVERSVDVQTETRMPVERPCPRPRRIDRASAPPVRHRRNGWIVSNRRRGRRRP